MNHRINSDLRSYADVYKDAVRVSSANRGWHGFTVNFDQFPPFERDAMCYDEHHLCFNVGRNVPTLRFDLDGHKFDGAIRRGEFLVTPAGQSARWDLRDEADALSIRLRPEFFIRVAESNGMPGNKIELIHKVPVRDSLVRTWSYSLLDELRMGNPAEKMRAECLANLLAIDLLRRHCSHTLVMKNPEEKLGQFHFNKIKERINDDIANPPSITEFAQMFDVSDSYVMHAFSQSQGISIHAYEVNTRISRAKILLSDLEKTAEQVARELGYRDVNFFYKQFKKQVGLTPGQFRTEMLCHNKKSQ